MIPAFVRLIDNKPKIFRKIHSAEGHALHTFTASFPRWSVN
jgi:hypothetical protein